MLHFHKLAAIFGLGLSLFSTTVFAQQAEADKVKAALEGFNAALSSLDIAKMDAVWAHDPDAILVNPRDKTVTVGWDAIKKNWESTFSIWSELKVSKKSGNVHVSGNTAWATGVAEVIGKTKGGDAVNSPTFETDIFEKRGDKWLLVSHSAWRIPQ